MDFKTRYEIAKKFLSFFGHPALRLLSDDKNKKIALNKYIKLDDAMTLNDNEEKKLGLFFTPNGDYGALLKDGDKLNIKKDASPTGLYHSFWVDIDNENTTLNDIKNIIDAYKIIPSFIVKSGGGWHLYFIFERGLKLDEKTFKTINEYLNSLFEGGDASNSHIAKLMRVPLSLWYKRGKKLVELYIYKGGEFKNVSNANDIVKDDIVKINKENIDIALKNIEENEKANKIDNLKVKTDSQIVNKASDIQKISIIDIIKAIVKSKSYKIYNDKEYYIALDKKIGNDTYALKIVYKDGNEQLTDGYRLKISGNYVNNFSDSFHPIEERPRGGPLSFLYYYFNKNWNAVLNFLKENFGLDVDIEDIGGKVEYEYLGTKLIFGDKGVYLLKKNKEGEDVYVKLFSGKVIINKYVIGKEKKLGGEVVKDVPIVGVEDNVKYYIAEKQDKGYKVLFGYQPSPKEFKNKYGKYGLRFLGSQQDLDLFYDILDANEENMEEIKWFYDDGIQTIETAYGFKDIVIIPNRVFYGEEYLEGIEYVVKIGTTPDKDLWHLKNQKEISFKEAFEKFSELWPEHKAILGFSQFFALRMMNLWDEMTDIYSGLFLTAQTGAGKTTFISILKNLLGLSFNYKRTTLGSMITTNQGWITYFADYTPTVIEEFTNLKDKQFIENFFRAVINRDSGLRGDKNSNIHRELRAGLIAIGEDSFASENWESVENRFVYIPLYQSDKKGDYIKVESMKNFNCKNDFYKLVLNNRFTKDEFNEYVQDLIMTIKNEDRLKGKLSDVDRYGKTYARAYLTAHKYLGLDKNIYKKALLKHIDDITLGKVGTNVEDNTLGRLQDFVIGALMDRKVVINKVYYKNGFVVEFIFESKYALSKKHFLIELKNKGWNVNVGHNVFISRFFKNDGNVETYAIEMMLESINSIQKYNHIYKDEQEYFII